MNALDEILALADVKSEDRIREARSVEDRKFLSKLRARRRLAEEKSIDPRVIEYVKEINTEVSSIGERIEWLYQQANAASSLDPITAGALQERVGLLREALSNVYEEIDCAKQRIALLVPRAVAP